MKWITIFHNSYLHTEIKLYTEWKLKLWIYTKKKTTSDKRYKYCKDKRGNQVWKINIYQFKLLRRIKNKLFRQEKMRHFFSPTICIGDTKRHWTHCDLWLKHLNVYKEFNKIDCPVEIVVCWRSFQIFIWIII